MSDRGAFNLGVFKENPPEIVWKTPLLVLLWLLLWLFLSGRGGGGGVDVDTILGQEPDWGKV